jgi:hypothetical protein
MLRWHESNCTRADVQLLDDETLCFSCGAADSCVQDDKPLPLKPQPVVRQQDGPARLWAVVGEEVRGKGSAQPPPVPEHLQGAQGLGANFHTPLQFGECIRNEANDATPCETKEGEEERILGPVNIPSESTRFNRLLGQVEKMSLDQFTGLKPVSWKDGDSQPSESDCIQANKQTWILNSYPKIVGPNHVRLLKLSRGRFSDKLHGDIITVPLNNGTHFEALSYTWADQHEDSSRSKKLYLGRYWDVLWITSNCEMALRRLRLPHENRVVWVDAICINQDDVQERNHQVGLMADLYSSAQRVLVYLGEPPKGVSASDVVLHLRHAYRHGAGIAPSSWRLFASTAAEVLGPIFRLPYFSRTWIIQEIAMARAHSVLFGDISTPWEWFTTPTIRHLAPAWIQFCDRRRYRETGDLANLLIDTKSSKASDPRDKVFGLLGLIQSAGAEGLVANYSCSVEEVFIGVALYLINKHSSIHILAMSGIHYKYSNFPSWVPDWSNPPDYTAVTEELDNMGIHVLPWFDTVAPKIRRASIDSLSLELSGCTFRFAALHKSSLTELNIWNVDFIQPAPKCLAAFRASPERFDIVFVPEGSDFFLHLRPIEVSTTVPFQKYRVIGQCHLAIPVDNSSDDRYWRKSPRVETKLELTEKLIWFMLHWETTLKEIVSDRTKWALIPPEESSYLQEPTIDWEQDFHGSERYRTLSSNDVNLVFWLSRSIWDTISGLSRRGTCDELLSKWSELERRVKDKYNYYRSSTATVEGLYPSFIKQTEELCDLVAKHTSQRRVHSPIQFHSVSALARLVERRLNQ